MGVSLPHFRGKELLQECIISPALACPSSAPAVWPTMYLSPAASADNASAMSPEEEPRCRVYCHAPAALLPRGCFVTESIREINRAKGRPRSWEGIEEAHRSNTVPRHNSHTEQPWQPPISHVHIQCMSQLLGNASKGMRTTRYCQKERHALELLDESAALAPLPHSRCIESHQECIFTTSTRSPSSAPNA